MHRLRHIARLQFTLDLFDVIAYFLAPKRRQFLKLHNSNRNPEGFLLSTAEKENIRVKGKAVHMYRKRIGNIQLKFECTSGAGVSTMGIWGGWQLQGG